MVLDPAILKPSSNDVYQQFPVSTVTSTGQGGATWDGNTESGVSNEDFGGVAMEELRKEKKRVYMDGYRKRKREEAAAAATTNAAEGNLNPISISPLIRNAKNVRASGKPCEGKSTKQTNVHMRKMCLFYRGSGQTQISAVTTEAPTGVSGLRSSYTPGNALDDDVGHHGNWEPDETDRTHFGEEDLDAADPGIQFDLPIDEEDDEARLYGLRGACGFVLQHLVDKKLVTRG
ncbi:hypothetical protein EJB05_27986 [Eragrostis curvula]|uniref:Uncharacterized protein n=1 Tax=Eragrostis curvula TaxID=38414 RepID=A0A5J9UQJ0_9POAL|nr:hypothetical protein EJB05_27986 [Eragrostis curvula]